MSGKPYAGFFSCGKVCGKPLPGCRHGCRQMCHAGCCERCEQEIVAKCRCGARTERIPCWKAQQMEGYNASNVVQILLSCSAACNSPNSTTSQDSNKQPTSSSPTKPESIIAQPSASLRWLWIAIASMLVAVLSLVLRRFLTHWLVFSTNNTQSPSFGGCIRRRRVGIV